MLKLVLYDSDPTKNPSGYWSDNARTALEVTVEDHSESKKLLTILAAFLTQTPAS